MVGLWDAQVPIGPCGSLGSSRKDAANCNRRIQWYCTVSAASVNLPGSVQHHVCGGGRIRLPGIATRIVLQLNKSSPESPECHIATRVNHQLMRPSPERFAATFTKIKMGDSRPTWHDWSAERCVKCTVAVTAGRQARLPKKSCEVRGTA
mmetsp:Transcript_17617/g.52921  ORF Transcript_17617/g.52921 Transcript_17617/m.52921 type:complete len:150 (+) Transcript_17617:4475-4924(+)